MAGGAGKFQSSDEKFSLDPIHSLHLRFYQNTNNVGKSTRFTGKNV